MAHLNEFLKEIISQMEHLNEIFEEILSQIGQLNEKMIYQHEVHLFL